MRNMMLSDVIIPVLRQGLAWMHRIIGFMIATFRKVWPGDLSHRCTRAAGR